MRLGISVLVCAILLTAGQVLWKNGLQRIGGFQLSITHLSTSLLSIMTSPYIVAGLVLYIVATLLWLNVLSSAPLSLAYPLMSVSYVLGIIAGCLFFGEQVPITRWLGAAVVCAGVCLMFRTGGK